MRLGTWKPWSFVCAGLLALTFACGDDKADGEAGDESETETGDNTGDGDPTTTGDGDGDPTTGDGDGDPTTGDGDGDPTTGDGDGDPTTGDGDGDPTTGDGDGDPTTGDGDGDLNPLCYDIADETECNDNPDCQSVTGMHVKENGQGAPCLEPSEWLGCIPMQGCGDAETYFCQNNNMWMVPDTCGPENAVVCEAPMDPLAECP